MVSIKTDHEIEIMREGGKKLARVMEILIKKTQAGMTTAELDKLAEELIKKQGGQPSFKEVPGYHWATCLSVNEGVVHGIPNKRPLKNGDILSIDMGMKYRGWHTDMAFTIQIKNEKLKMKNSKQKFKNNNSINKFLEAGKAALEKAIAAARAGNHVGNISEVIQQAIEGAGYSPVRELVGHGIGKQLHEEPEVPCRLDRPIKQTPLFRQKQTCLLKRGMVLAIEVIYNQGRAKVVYENDDGWTLKTADNSLSAMFEHTVAVTKKDALVLTA